MPAYAVAVDQADRPAAAGSVTFWGEVRRGLPEVAVRTAVVAAALEVGHLVHAAGQALGVLS